MTSDLLLQLEQKVAHAIEVIELLRMQVEELEDENKILKTEHDKWRNDLTSLIQRLDIVNPTSSTVRRPRVQVQSHTTVEEDYMTV